MAQDTALQVIISIHALREEGDAVSGWATRLLLNFYPRPPRGGRPGIVLGKLGFQRFLSTPSARRATPARTSMLWSWTNFYPRPPRGGRQHGRPRTRRTKMISIHALREEGDRFKRRQDVKLTIFLSTPSARRATIPAARVFLDGFISIHALREEGDSLASRSFCTSALFLSTPSARRATSWRQSGTSLWCYFYPRPPRGGRLMRRFSCNMA